MRRPNDIYNWYCVLHSITTIARHAVNIHAERIVGINRVQGPRKRPIDGDGGAQNLSDNIPVGLEEYRNVEASKPIASRHDGFPFVPLSSQGPRPTETLHPKPSIQVPTETFPNIPTIQQTQDDKAESATQNIPGPPTVNKRNDSAGESELLSERPEPMIETHSPEPTGGRYEAEVLVDDKPPPHAPVLKSSKVPSSRIGRLFHYGGLAASLGYGAAAEVLRRTSTRDENGSEQGSLLMTEANLNRLVSKLSQMRGAALKMGQFMSIQDTNVLPEDLERVFRRVQDAAHYMPNWQMEKMMESSLGDSWRSLFVSFNPIPSHAASIGQVHQGVLAASFSPTGKEEEVAIKIQFPNIVQSISSDLGYLKLLLGASFILPKGLFLDSTIRVFKEELADECNYKREAEYINKYRDKKAVKEDRRYRVPWVWEGSTKQVLVMERMKGVSVGGDAVSRLSQAERNEIAAGIVELCLRELFEFHMMQTDPNWTNFLWNSTTRQIELIDFGATREYSKEFTNNWLRLLSSAISGDREACIDSSLKLGYFIGGENEAMIDAHITSMRLLGTPFRESTPQPFSFAKGTEWTRITDEIRAQIPTMLNNRLTPPPRETYSLNRKLSGAFLLAARLNANIDCRRIWEKVVNPLSE